MQDFYPYFTNDGTVGLFSETDDDIYHSTHGAQSESWQKFIVPSGLREYLEFHNSVKILDICYGIGYNTKAALQVFVEKIIENGKSIKKKKSNTNLNIASIDTDKILTTFDNKYFENLYNSEQDLLYNLIYNYSICSDNTSGIHSDIKLSKNNILIDCIDIDDNLFALSPYITRGIKNNFVFKKYLAKKYLNFSDNKFFKINKISAPKIKPIKNGLKIKKEVLIILHEKLSEHLRSSKLKLNTESLLNIMSNKNYLPFFSKFMLNFDKFLQNKGYNMTPNKNKSTFLHNIYYQYLSKSYKNAKRLQKNNNFDINFYKNDARDFVKSTSNKYNYIFLDAFTPAKCPSLWTFDFFSLLYDKLENDGVIVTYSSSAAIRNAFMQSGFCVGKILDEKTKKSIGTIITKDSFLIKNKLDSKDLELINSKAGICYRDETLNSTNEEILNQRSIEFESSSLCSSSKVLKGVH